MIRSTSRSRTGETVYHNDLTVTVWDPVSEQWLRGDAKGLLKLHADTPRWSEEDLRRMKIRAKPAPLPKPPAHSSWLTLLEWADRWGTDLVPFTLFCRVFHPNGRPRNLWNTVDRLKKRLALNGLSIETLQEGAAYPAYSLPRETIDHVRAYFFAWDTARTANEDDNPELLNAALRDLLRLNKPNPVKRDRKDRRAEYRARYQRRKRAREAQA